MRALILTLSELFAVLETFTDIQVGKIIKVRKRICKYTVKSARIFAERTFDLSSVFAKICANGSEFVSPIS